MRLIAVAAVLGLGCSDYSNIDPSNPVPAWAQDEISCDAPPACEGEAAAKCLCADLPAWQLQDVNQNSDRFTETYGLDAFAGKVTVLSFYKVNCDFCGQQMGYLQVMQDELAAQGFDVAFATLLKKSGEVGTTCNAASDCESDQTCEQGFCHSSQQKVMSQQRNSYGACALFDSPNCDGSEMTSQISIKYPVFQDTEAAYAWQNDHGGGSKDEIYVYRPDGKLAAFFPSSSRLVFAALPDYRHLRATLKALSLGKLACDANNPCAGGQWCRQPELGTCGGSGFCVPQVEADGDGTAICPVELYPTPVCGCDQTTYGSACAAASSGVSLYDNGHCLD